MRFTFTLAPLSAIAAVQASALSIILKNEFGDHSQYEFGDKMYETFKDMQGADAIINMDRESAKYTGIELEESLTGGKHCNAVYNI